MQKCLPDGAGCAVAGVGAVCVLPALLCRAAQEACWGSDTGTEINAWSRAGLASCHSTLLGLHLPRKSGPAPVLPVGHILQAWLLPARLSSTSSPPGAAPAQPRGRERFRARACQPSLPAGCRQRTGGRRRRETPRELGCSLWSRSRRTQGPRGCPPLRNAGGSWRWAGEQLLRAAAAAAAASCLRTPGTAIGAHRVRGTAVPCALSEAL